ncbi:YicC/YloC family endoribonuclease [Natranaerobius thermophilus]|nr:YicC/YloC family endoribonuclease [Natranaerobius thermophilus]
MTGFGSGDISAPEMEGKVDVKTLNHKYLDINVKGPKELFSLEDKIRQEISRKVARGRVEVRFKIHFTDQQNIEAKFNKSLAESYWQGLQELKKLTGEAEQPLLPVLAKMPEVFSLEQSDIDEESAWEAIYHGILEALDEVVEMKEREGKKLKTDIIDQSKHLQEIVSEIDNRKSYSENKGYERLTQRLSELLSEHDIDENRIIQEAAIYSDKANIDEELVRMHSHLNQIEQFVEEEGAIGKKLDFLVQEMIREINTIASKSNDEIISKLVIEAKSIIEKIREQVQNVE